MLHYALITLLEFSSVNCGHCQNMIPVMQDIKLKYPELRVRNIDIDTRPNTAVQYHIKWLPTFILLVNNKEVGRFSGEVTEYQLINFIMKYTH